MVRLTDIVGGKTREWAKKERKGKQRERWTERKRERVEA